MRRDDGFTLIETLVSTVLGSLLMAALVGVFMAGYGSIRASQESLLGDTGVQLTLTYLATDVQGASRDPSLLTITNGGNTLKLAQADPGASGRSLTVTYTYQSSGTPAVGSLTRTVTDAAGSTLSTRDVAHNLKAGLTNIFSATPCTPAPGAGCTSVSASLAFDVKGTTITRSVQAAPRLAYP